MNDGIEPELYSLRYTSVDEAVQVILSLWQGAQMAKVDIKNAYRIILVYPTDRLLLGMYMNTALPFGLRSALKFLLLWQIHCSGFSSIRS